MINYSSPWHFARWRGSVAPKSLRWAVPCSTLAFVCHTTINEWGHWSEAIGSATSQDSMAFSLFTSILGFLLVFRAQLSYSRYWEGITLVERACGVWLNGYSNLFAFCNASPERRGEVDEFQYCLFQLMSLLLCCSFSDLTGQDRNVFQHFELEGIDLECTEYLENTSHKQYVIMQWLQRLVVENSRSGVVDIAPPILSRVFQEFSIGIVHFIDAKKLAVVPFPFQFAQMVWIMMVVFSIVAVPMVCALGLNSPYKAAAYTFATVFVFWSVHHIAVEIEMPFGDDENDLPMTRISRRFNKVLARLLDAKAQRVPRLLLEQPASRISARQSTFLSSASPYPFMASDKAPAGAKTGSWLQHFTWGRGASNRSVDDTMHIEQPRSPVSNRQRSPDTEVMRDITSSQSVGRTFGPRTPEPDWRSITSSEEMQQPVKPRVPKPMRRLTEKREVEVDEEVPEVVVPPRPAATSQEPPCSSTSPRGGRLCHGQQEPAWPVEGEAAVPPARPYAMSQGSSCSSTNGGTPRLRRRLPGEEELPPPIEYEAAAGPCVQSSLDGAPRSGLDGASWSGELPPAQDPFIRVPASTAPQLFAR